MAPRAGFQFHRKFLSEQVVQTSSELSTPSDTPRRHALDFWSLCAIACDTDERS
jgi:hypothetical protein